MSEIRKSSKRYIGRLGRELQKAGLRFRRSGFSNFGEEELLARLVAQLVPEGEGRTVVDIGAGDGVSGSNTYALFKRGWRGLGVEGEARRARRMARAYKNLPGVEAVHERVTPQNVLPLLRAHKVEREFGVLSLDIDSYDYWVLDALLSEFRPRVVVSEINEKIPPPLKFVVKYDPDFRLQHHFFGYSIASLEDLCERYSYALITLEYNNVFLAPRELPGVRPVPVEEAYRHGYLDRPDRRERFQQNADMELLHELSPEEAVKFLHDFYARHRDKYELSIAETAPCKGARQ